MSETSPSLAPATTIPRHREHLIDRILPAREVHLIAGPSGSGKTTVLMKLLEAFSRGEPVFGHASSPVPYVYITADRSKADMLRTLERVKIDPASFPYHIAEVSLSAEANIAAALKARPDAKLIVFEGIATFVPDGKLNDYKTVARFLLSLGALCEARDITLLGVAHTPKTREGERLLNPRERIMGSTAWAAYSNLILFLEPKDPDSTGKVTMREFYILPRNAPEEKFALDWKDGLLVPVSAAPKVSALAAVRAFLATLEPNEHGVTLFKVGDFLGSGVADISRKSVERAVAQLQEEKLLAYIKPGIYKVAASPAAPAAS